MKVKITDAVAFFLSLGFAKAPSWKPAAMQERLAALDEVVADPEFKAREEKLTPADLKLKNAVLKAIAAKEEIEVEVPVTAAAKKGAKSAPAAKGKTEKTPKAAKKSAGPRDFSRSNKAKVYNAWIKSKKKEEDAAKLMKVTDGTIKETSIKMWISGWKRGKGLPAIATQK